MSDFLSRCGFHGIQKRIVAPNRFNVVIHMPHRSRDDITGENPLNHRAVGPVPSLPKDGRHQRRVRPP